MTVTDELIDLYMSRFINRVDVWGLQQLKLDGSGGVWYCHHKPDMDTKGGRYKYEPVSRELVRRVFAGEVTCSWAALDNAGCSRWLCWDDDSPNANSEKIAAVLARWGFNTILEGVRPGRGGHLWLLFDHPIPARLLLRFALEVEAHAGVSIGKKSELERFPKSVGGYSQVRAPLSVHRKREANNCRGWFAEAVLSDNHNCRLASVKIAA